MKGGMTMLKKKNCAGIKSVLKNPKAIFAVLGVLIVLTLVSFGMVCRLYAKHSTEENARGGARVAVTGSASLLEHKASFNYETLRYELDRNTIVTSNTYEVVVPGIEIEKDPFVRLSGSNDVAYYLYIEVVPSDPEILSYSMSSVWTASNELSPVYGGTVYKFQNIIKPHEKRDIGNILSDNLWIRDDLKDKENPDVNSEPFRVDMYAYLVQAD